MNLNTQSLKVMALIPARSGSKGIPHKNIQNFCGKPLVAHSIEQAKQCPLVSRVIVSTDSESYAAIAREYGAEAPFLRPSEISGDFATDLETFQHALGWLKENEEYVPDLCVHLRPTHPNRTVADICCSIQILTDNPLLDSVRSVVLAPETPFKMWFMEGGKLRPVVESTIADAHSQPRQILPKVYLQNACVDVIRVSTLLGKNSMAGKEIGAYIMEKFLDIDTFEQMMGASENFLAKELPRGRSFCFDIDGVIASITPDNDYNLALPMSENISRVNLLFEAGNNIVLFTARGSKTGLDWRATTERQMQEWGVRYHELRFGKPAADYYIDDRMMSFQQLAALTLK